MKVSYHELHNKVINIRESGMRSEIQQYIDYSQQINQVHHVHFIQENHNSISIDVHHTARVD